MTAAAGLQPSNYSKIEKGERDISVEALDKIARFFDTTMDEIVHFEDKLPAEVTITDKTTREKLLLIEQLDEDDKQALFRIFDAMLTKAKFKDFFQKNMAAL